MAVHPLPPRRTSAPETPDPPAYDRRRAWLILAMVVAFMMINYADKSVLGLAAVPLMDELAIDKSSYGLISSSFYVLFSVSGLVVGLLSARWSTRTMLLVMAALWAVAQLPALVATVPALVAGRLLLGAAEGPAASMSMHTLYGWFPPGRRGMPSALQIGGAALGTAVAAPVLTWFIVNLGWRSAFVALAITSAAWCLVWYAVGKDGPYSAAAQRSAAGAAPASGTPGTGERNGTRPTAEAPAPPLSRLLLSGTVVGSVLSAFGSHWALAVSSAWLPVYLQTQLDLTASTASVAVSAVSVLSLLLLLSVPALVDRRKRHGRAAAPPTGSPRGRRSWCPAPRSPCCPSPNSAPRNWRWWPWPSPPTRWRSPCTT
ncbi:MFS transporter [Streptomyces geysiriensis]|uniref:MFS transporter n=1 Tax=Streptomyces geysiriensis TaxID=68207 RepID=UPI0027E0F168|nr:MFS transporter [Streptomyces geysiriensis]